jgi:hypothetical protein
MNSGAQYRASGVDDVARLLIILAHSPDRQDSEGEEMPLARSRNAVLWPPTRLPTPVPPDSGTVPGSVRTQLPAHRLEVPGFHRSMTRIP